MFSTHASSLSPNWKCHPKDKSILLSAVISTPHHYPATVFPSPHIFTTARSAACLGFRLLPPFPPAAASDPTGAGTRSSSVARRRFPRAPVRALPPRRSSVQTRGGRSGFWWPTWCMRRPLGSGSNGGGAGEEGRGGARPGAAAATGARAGRAPWEFHHSWCALLAVARATRDGQAGIPPRVLSPSALCFGFYAWLTWFVLNFRVNSVILGPCSLEISFGWCAWLRGAYWLDCSHLWAFVFDSSMMTEFGRSKCMVRLLAWFVFLLRYFRTSMVLFLNLPR